MEKLLGLRVLFMWTDKHRKVWRIWIYSSQLQTEQEAEGISDLCLLIRNTLLRWSEGFVWMLGGFLFFFLPPFPKKRMLFSSNWQKHTPNPHGIFSRSTKHVAIWQGSPASSMSPQWLCFCCWCGAPTASVQGAAPSHTTASKPWRKAFSLDSYIKIFNAVLG